jgi:translation elongation factor EF-Tu-like GTPase
MTTTITVQGVTYVIPNDKVNIIVDLLKSYSVAENKRHQVKEVLISNPNSDNRVLING